MHLNQGGEVTGAAVEGASTGTLSTGFLLLSADVAVRESAGETPGQFFPAAPVFTWLTMMLQVKFFCPQKCRNGHA